METRTLKTIVTIPDYLSFYSARPILRMCLHVSTKDEAVRMIIQMSHYAYRCQLTLCFEHRTSYRSYIDCVPTRVCNSFVSRP